MITKPYSQLRAPDRLPLARLLPLDFPLSIHIEVTNRCNFKCRCCPVSFEEYPAAVGGHATISMDMYQRICQEINDSGVTKVVRFYMVGEPLLHGSLPEMIKQMVQSGRIERTELTTNASMLNETIGSALVESGLDYVRVSIYSADQKRHQEITGSKISVLKIRENVKKLREIRDEARGSKPFIYVKMLNSYNEAENARFLEMYAAIADEAVIEEPMNWNGYENRNLMLSFLGSGVDARDRGRLIRAYDGTRYEKVVCPFPFYTLVINANGDATVCCVDWNKKTFIGNVAESSISAIWSSSKMREFRRMHVEGRRHENESCRNCTYLLTTPDTLDNLSPDAYEKILGRM